MKGQPHSCDAKIRPFPSEVEVTCDKIGTHTEHDGVVKDMAYPGSRTVIKWEEGDRRTFRGKWKKCEKSYCILPSGHHGNHAG